MIQNMNAWTRVRTRRFFACLIGLRGKDSLWRERLLDGSWWVSDREQRGIGKSRNRYWRKFILNRKI